MIEDRFFLDETSLSEILPKTFDSAIPDSYTVLAICSTKQLAAQVLTHLGRLHFQNFPAVCISPLVSFSIASHFSTAWEACLCFILGKFNFAVASTLLSV
jgi:hypothetical protein